MKPKPPKPPPPPKPPKNLTGKTITTPDGKKIRNGNRYPVKRSTLETQAKIIERVAQLIVRRATRTEIHEAVREEFGIQYLQCDLTYVKRAQEMLRKQANMTADQARHLGVNILLDVVRGPSKPSDRISAESRLADIFGYNAPRRTELAGPGGTDLPAMVVQVVGTVAVQERKQLAQAPLQIKEGKE